MPLQEMQGDAFLAGGFVVRFVSSDVRDVDRNAKQEKPP